MSCIIVCAQKVCEKYCW